MAIRNSLLILLFPVLLFAQWGMWSDWGKMYNDFRTPTTITFDSLGTDSTEWYASGWDKNPFIIGFWIGLGDTLFTQVADTVNMDSLIYLTDTTAQFHWKHGLTKEASVFYLLVVTDGSNYIAKTGSVFINEIIAPDAGTITYHNFIPPYNDSLAFTASPSEDVAEMEIYAWTESGEDSVLIYTGLDTLGLNLSLVGMLSYVGDDTLIVSVRWIDDEGLRSPTVRDTLLPTGTPNLYLAKANYDSLHSALNKFKIGISNSNVAGSANWSMLVNAGDTLTTMTNDTICINLPDTLITQHPVSSPGDTVYVWTIIQFKNPVTWSPDTSDVAKYYEHEPDVTPPDSVSIFTATGDALGKDTLRTIIKNYNSPAAKDSGWIFYKLTSEASSVADSTKIIRNKFAVADSANNDTIGYSIDWDNDYTIHVYFVQNDSLSNTQIISKANHSSTTVDSLYVGVTVDSFYNATATGAQNNAANRTYITRFTAPRAGTLDSAKIGVDCASGGFPDGTLWRIVVYEDDGGSPPADNYLDYSAEQNTSPRVTADAGWSRNLVLTQNYTFSQSQLLWLGITCSGQAKVLYDTATGNSLKDYEYFPNPISGIADTFTGTVALCFWYHY